MFLVVFGCYGILNTDRVLAYSYFLVLMGNTFVCYVAGEKNAFNHRWGYPSNPWGY